MNKPIPLVKTGQRLNRKVLTDETAAKWNIFVDYLNREYYYKLDSIEALPPEEQAEAVAWLEREEARAKA